MIPKVLLHEFYDLQLLCDEYITQLRRYVTDSEVHRQINMLDK